MKNIHDSKLNIQPTKDRFQKNIAKYDFHI